MEQCQANIDALTSDREVAVSRIFAHVSHAMEFYSLGGVVIFNIFKVTLMP